ncbi:MAG: LCP family protein [Candidatus Magasanikbacteria bacterium]|jgi:polyisoprenyl-teichoic acid--peptidoglycan teichoic acid transferase|nr:LCP family protein [Candidatus Magasanikbacteria bacterium]MBT4547328.1 LCP family protein [Candidatus Magasanikbacteria bacterium]MBT6819255.1 LCP family protein [Candidatus Magasanikbacteria bacterium]
MERRQINFLSTETHQEELTKSPNPRRTIFWVFLIFIILIIGGCVTKSITEYSAPNDPAAYDPNTLEPKEPQGFFKKMTHYVLSKTYQLEGEKNDRINVLLLGMGGVGHDGPFLTDTIIIASLRPSTGQIAMISIPRDLGAEIPGHGWYKINHASAFGEAKKRGNGSELAKEVIEDTFDIDIHYYTRVDFTAFSEIIDEVGGVTVNVDRSFTDEMFPADNHEFQTVSFEKGTKIMDGITALQYARSRHGGGGEGSDFARAKRQQKIILALKEKLLSFSTLINPLKINNIIKTLDTHIDTDLEFSDLMSFLRLTKELDTDNIITVVLDDSPNGFLKNGYSPDGAFILEPKTGNFDDITLMIENVFEEVASETNDTPDQVAPTIQQLNIEIKNGTWVVGMAARFRKNLQEKGFYISSVGNTEERPKPQSAIYKISPNGSIVALALQQELGIPIKENLPIGVLASTSTEILIILGDDIEEKNDNS